MRSRTLMLMNNLKFIILDCFAARKFGILYWRRDFCDWSISNHSIRKVVPSRHLTECNTLGDNALHKGCQQWWSLETWFLSRDASRYPFFEVSVSEDFGLGLELFVSRLCIGYFLWSFARSSFKKRFYKMIVQNLAVQRGQWLNFLCCYVVCEMEKTICPLPRLKFILNSIKNVHAPMKPQCVISAARGWEYFAKDYLWAVFPRVLLWNP